MLLATSSPYPNVPEWITSRVDHIPEWLVFLFQFKTYIALFTVAATFVAVATPVYVLLARRLGWVDRPGGRKQHATTTATMGGLVVFAPIFAGAAVALALDNRVGEMLREHRSAIYTLLACTACMIGLGIIDDRFGVRPMVKLLVQLVVAVAAVSLDYRIHAFTLPWLDSVVLPDAVGVILSIVWIVGITNAINLTDGLDGLAAGVCLLAAAVNAVVAVWLENYYMAAMMFLLAGALLGFLRWNFHPARCFLGDTGALALGMFLALCSLRSAQKAHTVVMILIPLFALGYPIFDTLLTIARRSLRGQPLFASDRDHIHHRLLERGATHTGAAIQIYIVSIILCIGCLAAVSANHQALGLAITAVLLIAVFCVRFLGYLEWGGWLTRWRGREDTRLLHLATTLARLRIQRARGDRQLLAALAVFAEEIGCRRITLSRGDAEVHWASAGEDAAAQSNDAFALDFPISDTVHIRLGFATSDPLDGERSRLLDELCRQLGGRIIDPETPGGGQESDHKGP